MLAVDDDQIPAFHKNDPHSGVTVTAHSHHDTYDAISPKHADLTGKAVFISGASRGIGRGIAVSYAQAGASFLALAARGSMNATVAAVKEAAAAAGKPEPKVLSLTLDAADPESTEAAAKKTTAEFGRLDILVNNAAVLEPLALVHDSNPIDWWRSFEINLKGVYLVSRALLPLLLDTKEGGLRTIVNVTSIGGIQVIAGLSAYNTSKLAVCRFTEFLAQEYADQGLATVSVHPGGVISDMSMTLPKELHSLLTDTAELVSDTIVWLTREPRPWLSGRYVSVQWDMPELEARKDEIVQKNLLVNRLLC